jgi:hypothetical protein
MFTFMLGLASVILALGVGLTLMAANTLLGSRHVLGVSVHWRPIGFAVLLFWMWYLAPAAFALVAR